MSDYSTKTLTEQPSFISCLNLTPARISDSVLVFDGNYPGGGNVTAAVVHSEKEALMFDSLLYPQDTRELSHTLRRMNLKTIGLVNTHWHVDHTAGNQFFFGTERIISHSLCPDLMRSDDLDWLNKDSGRGGKSQARLSERVDREWSGIACRRPKQGRNLPHSRTHA